MIRKTITDQKDAVLNMLFVLWSACDMISPKVDSLILFVTAKGSNWSSKYLDSFASTFAMMESLSCASWTSGSCFALFFGDAWPPPSKFETESVKSTFALAFSDLGSSVSK